MKAEKDKIAHQAPEKRAPLAPPTPAPPAPPPKRVLKEDIPLFSKIIKHND